MSQIIKCPCGKIFAACAEPYCYTDAEWHRDVRAYVKKGCTVSMAEKGEVQKGFDKCTCPGMNPKLKQPSLFEKGGEK